MESRSTVKMSKSLILLLVSIFCGKVTGKCSDGAFVYGNSCYLDFNIRATWAEASIICQAYGGYLANINDIHEQHVIQTVISRNIGGFSPGIFWLGGTDIQIEGEWVWTGNVEAFGTYKNWSPGEPNNAGSNEHCLEMDMNGNYQWNDNNCQNRFNFICEIPTTDPGITAGGQGIIGKRKNH
ncbi:perlucin-like [Saccostrea echinata]|uniref:perlucin-like n=1 Tax=Saccostrea echinata TaxID=191078 RepID=UPI002A81A95F|nr:perlucin-like [Saccostrea echinata]